MKYLLWMLMCFPFTSAKAQDSIGCKFLDKKVYEALPHFKLTKLEYNLQIPNSFYINTPPIGNQGEQNSCVGWAVGYTYLSTVQHNGESWDINSEKSPSFIFNQIRDSTCSGSTVKDALTLILVQGDCSLASMPFVENDCVSLPNAEQKKEALRFKADGVWLAMDPNDIDAFINTIYKGKPVIVAFAITPDFLNMWNSGHGIWSSNNRRAIGRVGHCVCLIGYDNVKKMFKAQNQWGTRKGDKGYFWVTYALVQSGCFREAYTFSTP